MVINPDSPVTVIEGIGSSSAEALASIGVFNVFDLLRGTVAQLHSAVNHFASEMQVSKWRDMSSLLQIVEVTPQWAEGLTSGGIDSIGELASKNVEDVQDILTKAQDDGLIPDVPTVSQIAAMIRDATVIQHTGVLTLTVRNQDDASVVGATASIGTISSNTDQRGRVRIIRIPLGSPIPLRIEHEDYGTLLIDNPPIIPDHLAIGVTVLVMPNPGDSEDSSTHHLSEYNGDELPVPGNHPRKEVTLSAGELREGDLLEVRHFYKLASDVQLVSMLKDYRNGEFIAYQYRVPISSFESPPKLRNAYVFRNGSFLPFTLTMDRLHNYKIRRRMVKAFSDRPAPTNLAEAMEGIVDRLTFLAENGGLKGFARLRI